MSVISILPLACLLACLFGWQVARQRAAGVIARSLAKVRGLQGEITALQALVAQRGQIGEGSMAKTRFLANVTHEVRTPLAGILGLADLLAATKLSGEQGAYVEAIRTCGSSLAALIDEILDFSRMEAGKLELALEPVNLVALMEGVVELLAPAAQEKKLEIAAMAQGAIPALVLGDSARLRQILLNLAGNAVKFTEAGGVGIVLSRRGNRVEFSVRDTGCGVPDNRRTAIFDEFEQADGSTSQKYRGTGLGLAIARRLALAMDGELQLLHSTPAGSEFRLSLPLLLPVPEPAPAPAFQTAGGNPVALIVANSHFESAYLSHQLQGFGFQTEVIASSDDACRRLESAPVPALMIADCALGATASQALADAAWRAGVGRTLILFSPRERREFGQALTEGYAGWLVKPVRSLSLQRLVGGDAGPADLRFQPMAPALHAGLNVLLAEDNDINALVATHQLDRMGARTSRANDGPTALAMARRAILGEAPLFDLILLDLRMPGLDGRDVVRAIRRLEQECGSEPVRIIALTASLAEGEDVTSASAGFDDVMTKPLDTTRLSQKLAAARPERRSA